MDEKFNRFFKNLDNKYPKKDLDRVKKAFEFAKDAHKGQDRLSGEKYIAHPLAVAETIAGWGLDANSVIAALLHDVLEDTGIKRTTLEKEFGKDVLKLVEGVTKVTGLRLRGSKQELYVENLRKMLLYMAQDLRVILLKLADRLHNMQTLWALNPEKQLENAHETLEIYAPLAERMGIGKVKGELEDLAFPYVYPEEYSIVKKRSEKYYKEAEKDVNKMTSKIKKDLEKEEVECEIHGRKKHLYSLWKKLERAEIDWDFEKIHDIVALRILVESIPDCYVALGFVHDNYKPVPNLGISDFIAQPKPNGYRSIHTKVFGPDGHIAEIQIRTFEMHAEAEYGVAAHWAYSEAKSKGIKDKVLEEKGVATNENKLNWVKQLVAWQDEISDSKEFLDAVKFDAFNKRNFIFSPEGDVYDLPEGATPVDFAFSVHTDLGHYIKGAKVDGKIVPLDFKLKSGSVVEILKSKEKRNPNRDWLRFVVTTSAKREINKFFRNRNGS